MDVHAWRDYRATIAHSIPASARRRAHRWLSHTRASVTIARKLARRAFHTLRGLGAEAIVPAS